MIARCMLVVVALTVTGCAAPRMGVEQPGDVTGPPKAWHRMSFDARKEYMRHVVLPTMKDRFQKFDPDYYSDFACGTCHGETMKARKFKMPTPDLPRLPEPGSPAWNREVARKTSLLRFMKHMVVPTMAQLLGKKPYDPQTDSGFGCFNCHTKRPPEQAQAASEQPSVF